MTPTNIRELPDRRSLRDHGPYSAYCRVCWNPVFALWIDDEPPGDACPLGATGDSCANAIGYAKDAATFARLRRDGLLV